MFVAFEGPSGDLAKPTVAVGLDDVSVSHDNAVALPGQYSADALGERSAVFARDGAVFVVAEGGSVRLGAGEGVDVTQTGSVGAVVRWGQARIDLFDDLLGPDW